MNSDSNPISKQVVEKATMLLFRLKNIFLGRNFQTFQNKSHFFLNKNIPTFSLQTSENKTAQEKFMLTMDATQKAQLALHHSRFVQELVPQCQCQLNGVT